MILANTGALGLGCVVLCCRCMALVFAEIQAVAPDFFIFRFVPWLSLAQKQPLKCCMSRLSMPGPGIPLGCACQPFGQEAETVPMVESTAFGFQDWKAQWQKKLQARPVS